MTAIDPVGLAATRANRQWHRHLAFLFSLWAALAATLGARAAEPSSGDRTYDIPLRWQEETADGSQQYHRLVRQENWSASDTAVVVCDMWDSHHCLNAVRRVGEVAPRMNALLTELRSHGATIIHAPSGCMEAYKDHPARLRATAVQPASKRLPLADWQRKLMNDPDKWLVRDPLTGGGEIDTQVALDYGLVDAQVADHAAALHELGLMEDPPVVEGPWLDNAIQQILAREWLPRLLVVLGFMALMIEMGSPGLGVGGFVAALCFLGFFWIEGLNGNVAWLEVLLFVGGLVSLAIELFVLPGFGLFGIGGILMVFTSIVLASQTFVFPSNSEQLTIIANNLFWVAISALVVLVGLVMMGKRLENTPVLRWVTIEPAGIDDVAELEQREAIVHWEHLLGQDGLTTTRCNPAGKAQFGRQVVNVLGTHLIDEGVPVRVVEVRGNSVFVEPLE